MKKITLRRTVGLFAAVIVASGFMAATVRTQHGPTSGVRIADGQETHGKVGGQETHGGKRTA